MLISWLFQLAFFCHLSRNQILRVYDQYEAIKKYAKSIGTHVVDNTNAMGDDPLKYPLLLKRQDNEIYYDATVKTGDIFSKKLWGKSRGQLGPIE
jgi:hypothetical protein